MQSQWRDQEAEEYIAKYKSYGEDIALRVYTSRLIGKNPNCTFLVVFDSKRFLTHFEVVLHGGGNTSVKISVTTDTNEVMQVIAVKGSGWELSNIGKGILIGQSICVDI